MPSRNTMRVLLTLVHTAAYLRPVLFLQVATVGVSPYNGVLDCITRTVQEEGAVALYKSLGPRLISVVPMIGIQVPYIYTLLPVYYHTCLTTTSL
jgi:Mitochondrial carrier protein